tara:strand:+ start:441 stop:710 length:270 start_codon:yes stop_codon:yes gene_type:complete
MKRKKTKLTYEQLATMIVKTRQEFQALNNEVRSMFFLFNSLLDMDGKTKKLTKYVEEKVNAKEEDDTATDGKKEQAKGSRATKAVSKPS